MSKEPFNSLEEQSRPELIIDTVQDNSSEQVSIIIVHKDRPEYLNICLQSIHVMSNMNNFEIIVVDNGSGKDSQDFLDALEDEGIKVVRRKGENLWWSHAANEGVKVADINSKYFIFMHCDTVVLDFSWMDMLINLAEANESGLIGLSMGTYLIAKQKVDFIQEWCMLMTRQCWNDIGPWPEELPMVGHAFIMTLRAQIKGYKPQSMKNKPVHHYKVFSMKPSEYTKMTEEARFMVGKLMAQTQAV